MRKLVASALTILTVGAFAVSSPVPVSAQGTLVAANTMSVSTQSWVGPSYQLARAMQGNMTNLVCSGSAAFYTTRSSTGTILQWKMSASGSCSAKTIATTTTPSRSLAFVWSATEVIPGPSPTGKMTMTSAGAVRKNGQARWDMKRFTAAQLRAW